MKLMSHLIVLCVSALGFSSLLGLLGIGKKIIVGSNIIKYKLIIHLLTKT